MKRELGLWIDHSEAVIASVLGKEVDVRRIKSHLEKHARFTAGAAGVAGEDNRDRRFANHLQRFYDEVIASIRDADAILIFGPGEAKGELQNRLKALHLDGRIVGVETTDKLSDRQIVAKVREHFLPE